MSIPVKDFIAQVKAIAAEEPKYRLGGYGKDGTCDCIGLTIGAIRRAGGTWGGTHGSNYAARNEMATLERNTMDNLFVGKQVLKAREKGHAKWALPSRYSGSPDQRDYYHAGVVTSIHPLRITHSTGTGLPSSIKVDTVLGAWGWGGRLKKVSYENEVERSETSDRGQPQGGSAGAKPTTLPSGAWAENEVVELSEAKIGAAKIVSENGKPVRMRDAPNSDARTLAKLPVGTAVTVYEQADGWAMIGLPEVGGTRGYMMARFLRAAQASEPATGLTVTLSTEERLDVLEARQKLVDAWIAAHDGGGVQG